MDSDAELEKLVKSGEKDGWFYGARVLQRETSLLLAPVFTQLGSEAAGLITGICNRNKSWGDRKQGSLKPLPIPDRI
jgi:hypothetical protein